MGSFNLNIWRKIPLKISAKSDKQTKPQSATYLSIIDEIDREDENPDTTVDEVEQLNVDAHQGEDCHEQAKEDEDKEDAEEDAAAHCEINLGLKQFSFDIKSA